MLAAALALTGAGCGGRAPAASAQRPAGSVARPTPASAPSAVPYRKHERSPVFTAKVSRIQQRSQVRYSWHPGCPVAVSGLRLITMTYRGFDHKVHTGRLVVNAAVTGKLILVFRKLFAVHYPIRRMVPVDVYHGSDYASIQADNTSAFNCRDATGSSSWSEHAYGLAVDLDPCENPYISADGHGGAQSACRKICLTGTCTIRASFTRATRWCAPSPRPAGAGAAPGRVPVITSTSPRTAGNPPSVAGLLAWAVRSG